MTNGAKHLDEKYYQQEVITDIMKEMGYRSSENGVCAGIAMMAVQADRVGKLDDFIDRLRLIRDTPDVIVKINQAKEKNKQRTPLSSLEKQYLEIPALFEGIELYYQPELYREFIGQPVSQSEVFIEKISQVAASIAVEKEKGIQRVGHSAGIYENEQLNKQIKAAGDLLANNPSVSLTLGSSDHRVTLLKSNDGRLFLIDPRKLPLQKVEPSQLSDAIYTALFPDSTIVASRKGTNEPRDDSVKEKSETKETQMFFVDIFSIGNVSVQQAEAIKKVVQQLQNINPIPAIAQNKMPNDATMMHVAAMTGNTDMSNAIKKMVLQKLQEKTKDNKEKVTDESVSKEMTSYFTHQTKEGYTPFHLAAYFGHEGFIEHMLQVSSEAIKSIDTPNNEKSTPLHMASANGFDHVIKVLLKYEVDTNKQDKHGKTPLHYIAQTGNAVAAKELFKYKKSVDPDVRDNDYLTPAHYAAKEGHVEMLQVLAQNKALLDEPNDTGKTPLTMAVEGKHWDAAAYLMMNRVKKIENADEDIEIIKTTLHSVQDELLKAYLRFIRNMKNDEEKKSECKKFMQQENALGDIFNPSSKDKYLDSLSFDSAAKLSSKNVFSSNEAMSSSAKKWVDAIEKEFKDVLHPTTKQQQKLN